MIKLICVGKIKEDYFNMAILEYTKRLSKYTKLDIVEIPDFKIEDKAKEIEGEKILSKIKDKDYVVTLDIKGKELTSEEFASKLDELFTYNSNITFVIGGSYGLSLEVKKRSNYSVSFSKLTFPHKLFRVIFLEQLYRAFKINSGEKYHK